MNKYILDDKKEYYIFMEKSIDSNRYILFSEVNNPSNICFRKEVINKDRIKGFIPLGSEDEFNKITLEFLKDII